jgi:hypothetical protein
MEGMKLPAIMRMDLYIPMNPFFSARLLKNRRQVGMRADLPVSIIAGS